MLVPTVTKAVLPMTTWSTQIAFAPNLDLETTVIDNLCFMRIIESHDMPLPLVLSTMAGLSTCLGAAVVFLFRNRQLGHSHMAFSLSLAGSVMMTVCLVSILPEVFQFDGSTLDSMQVSQRCLSLCVGCAMYLGLSKFAFPQPEDLISLGLKETSHTLDSQSTTRRAVPRITPTTTQNFNVTVTAQLPMPFPLTATTDAGGDVEEQTERKRTNGVFQGISIRGNDLQDTEARRAWRLSLVLFVSLAVHNFPEGLAVAVSTMHNMRLGWTTALAIAFHNIPEGIAIAIPCLAARPDFPVLAFGLASLSGLAEPLGAAMALAVFDPSRGLELENVLSFVAGVMMMVALLDLFSEAFRYMKNENKFPGFAGTVAGIAIMLVTEIYLGA